ncbi:MAG: PepSY-associated TM helix domain-containing protein [Pseudomonadota bacterium]
MKRGRLWFRIHSFVGLNLSLLLGLIFFTGTLAVFSSEIDWLFKPQMRASATVAPADLPWEAIAVSLAEHVPDGRVEVVEAGPSPIFAPAAYVTLPDGPIRVIYFDSETGAVQGEGPLLSAKSLLRSIHSRLLIPDPLGTTLVSLLSLFLLISLATALLIYKKWWRGFFKLPRVHRSRRIFWGDVHRLLGVWGMVFGLLMGTTGLWYFVEEIAAPAPLFSDAATPAAKIDNGESAIRFPAALAAARTAYPDLSIRRIAWPGADSAAFGFYGQDGTVLVRPRASGVIVDAFEASVIDRHSGSEATVHQRISEAADPLHMGYFAGYWSKALWFVFGLMMTVLAFSGATIFVKRLARDDDAASPAERRKRKLRIWLGWRNGLGAGLLLAVLGIGSILYFLRGEIGLLV